MTQAATQDTEAQSLPTPPPEIIDPLDHELLPAKGGYKDGKRNTVIDVGRALTLRIDKNLSYQEIATQLSKETGYKLSKEGVYKRLRPFTKLIEDPTAIKAYETNKESLLSAVEHQMLVEMVNPDKLEKASTNNIAYAFQQIFNANRLQRDKSTSNVSVKSVVEDIRRRKEELEKKRPDCG